MSSGKEYKLAIRIAGKVDPSVKKSASKAQSLFSTIVKADLVSSAIKKVSASVVGFASSAVDTYTEFNQSMANTAAIAGAVGEEYEMLNSAARAAGKATTFTAAEAADALGYMALAGWDALTSTQALTPVLKLAEATQADLATTSDQVTDSMSAMGVGINDLQDYLNTMVQTNNKANTTAGSLMDALIKCGGAAQAAGLNYKETSTALGILANNGVKGAEAGTALNSMLVRMTSKDTALTAMKKLGVSVYDASGEVRDFEQILVDVNSAMKGMTEEQQNAYMSAIAGTNYYTQFSYLLKGVEEGADGSASAWDSLAESLNNADGALDAMDEAATNTVSGALARLQSAADDVKISFMDAFGENIISALDWFSGNIMPGVSDAMADFSGFLNDKALPAIGDLFDLFADGGAIVEKATGFMEEHRTALEVAAIGVGALTAALIAYKAPAIIATVTNAAQMAGIWAYCTATEAATVATGIFSGALAFLTSPITIAIGAIAGIIAIGALLYNNWDTLSAKASAFAAAISEKFPWMASIVDAAGATIGNICGGIKNIFGGITGFIKGVFAGDWAAAWQGIVDTFGGIFGAVGGLATAPLNLAIGVLNTAISGLNKISVTIPDWVPALGGKTIGFNIPSIPTIGLASGGIATGPTNALIGEGGEPEAVLPLSKLIGLLEQMGIEGNGGITFAPVINVNGNESVKSQVDTAMDEAFEKFKMMMAQYEREKKRKAFV